MAENGQDPSLLNSVKERIQFAYDSKELADCEFSVGVNEVSVKAHKFFMSVASPVFKAMFHGDLAESGAAPIRVPDITPNAFNGLLQFMYTDKVDLASPKHAAQVLQAAQKYIVPHLVTVCNDYIRNSLDTSTVYDVCEFAESHKMEDVTEVCVAHLKSNTTLLVNDDRFKDADLSVVKLIVQQNELNIESELELFKAVERWAVTEADKRAVAVDDLLPELEDVISSIRFMAMSVDDLTSGVEKSPLLSNEEKTALVTNKVKSNILPYPQRLSTCTEFRQRPVSVGTRIGEAGCNGKAVVKEWELKRKLKNQIGLCINKYTNAFPKKSFTVSRPIKLKGLELITYPMNVKIMMKDWKIEVDKTSGNKFNFPQCVCLVPGEVYWIIINSMSDAYCNCPYYVDVDTTYKLNNITITMSDHYSCITKMFFQEY